jgi:ectoine hydroxylase-related dioxygenase (phytanoyl-CoA dioxygenase family)
MDELRQALFEIELYGFTLLEGVLSADGAAAIRAVTARLLESHGADLEFMGRAGHVTNLPTLDPIYFPLIDHPRILPVLEAVMGENLILASLNARVVRPGEDRQRLHADVPEALHRNGAPVMMNTVWLLDDCTEKNGATYVVPGSHRMGRRCPPDDVHVPRTVRAVAPAGSVLMFNGQCWHGGGANRASKARHCLFGHYRVADWTRFQVDPHRGFPEAWVTRLNDRQKRLMRMHKGLGHPHASDYDEV